ncbi:DUF4097 domain-containing protein (plasmid) [Streptomyces sp. NBC_01343]|uniref:DUF4097 family beta strand repeat-containing protein n=1 Tax=Streptomyces sp. NBC_01343 TaxID=2903832 RepID=UPI002E0DD369|nr:DUF4097 domain-containing protein [Streptomyces sp. NBC_01343]
MQKFETTGPIAVVLDVAAGRVQLIAADRGDVVVEVRPVDVSKGRDVRAAEETKVGFVDGVLRIATAAARHQVLGASGSVEVTVQLPAGSRVEAKAAAVDFRGVGRLGEVVFEGAQGVVKLDETASARLALQAGDVWVGRLVGDAELGAQKGDLRIDEAAGGSVVLRTGSGDISVGAARGVSASLDAGTSYGRISNSLHNTDGASAALNIRATTAHGDITARSL